MTTKNQMIVKNLQSTNPYADKEMIEAEIEGFGELSEKDQNLYIKELQRLAIDYKWNDHRCPMDGRFF